METIINSEYLKTHPNEIFVFGDNQLRIGYGGAAKLRDHVNTYGFITKKEPNDDSNSFYKPNEYEKIFYEELRKLITIIKDNPDKIFLISKLGAGLANKYNIWEEVIFPKIKKFLKKYSNVKFLWDEEHEEDFVGYFNNEGKLIVIKALPDLINNIKLLNLKMLPIIKATSLEQALEKYKMIC